MPCACCSVPASFAPQLEQLVVKSGLELPQAGQKIMPRDYTPGPGLWAPSGDLCRVFGHRLRNPVTERLNARHRHRTTSKAGPLAATPGLQVQAATCAVGS